MRHEERKCPKCGWRMARTITGSKWICLNCDYQELTSSSPNNVKELKECDELRAKLVELQRVYRIQFNELFNANCELERLKKERQ